MAYSTEYYQNNKEKIKENNLKYFQTHKEEINRKRCEYNKKKRIGVRETTEKICPICGTAFHPMKKLDQKYCCSKCTQRAGYLKLKETGYFSSDKYKIQMKAKRDAKKLKVIENNEINIAG